MGQQIRFNECEVQIDWKKDSQSFDTVAELYDAFRPGYPAALIDDILFSVDNIRGLGKQRGSFRFGDLGPGFSLDLTRDSVSENSSSLEI